MTNLLKLTTAGLAGLVFMSGTFLAHAAPRQTAPLARSSAEPMDASPPLVRVAAGADCSQAARQARAQTGGQVLSVVSQQQGGRIVCVVTLLVPSSDGGRPRKTTITIPQ